MLKEEQKTNKKTPNNAANRLPIFWAKSLNLGNVVHGPPLAMHFV